jgi:hypothetical protein
LDDGFGQGTADAVEQVGDILTEVHRELFDGKQMIHPPMVNLGIILKQVMQEKRYDTPLTSGRRFNDRGVMQRAARYARYASTPAGLDKAGVVEHIGALQAEDILHLHRSTSMQCPHFFVTQDPETTELALCVQSGLQEDSEAMRDAVSTKETFLGGRAHSEIANRAKQVVKSVKEVLSLMITEQPRRNVVVIGHGLAGGTAILAMTLLAGEDGPLRRHMAAGKVKCYAFAPPPIFEPLSALPSWVHDATYTFINNMDCVPRACLGTVSKLLLALQHVDALPLTTTERVAFLRGSYSLEEKLPDYVEAPQDYLVKLGTLCLVGNIILLYQGELGEIHCETITPEMADRILIHPAMLKDHTMKGYEEATSAAALHVNTNSWSLW